MEQLGQVSRNLERFLFHGFFLGGDGRKTEKGIPTRERSVESECKPRGAKAPYQPIVLLSTLRERHPTHTCNTRGRGEPPRFIAFLFFVGQRKNPWRCLNRPIRRRALDPAFRTGGEEKCVSDLYRSIRQIDVTCFTEYGCKFVKSEIIDFFVSLKVKFNFFSRVYSYLPDIRMEMSIS